MITGREIGERFIRAYELHERSGRVGPKGDGNAWMETIHTSADMNGWGTQRIADERKAFWDQSNVARPWELSEAAETMGWLSLVKKEDERRALVNWAQCMAERYSDNSRSFKLWCASERIHPETGRRRKERAILRILLALSRKPLQHNENCINRVLPDTPKNGHKVDNIAEAATYWRSDDLVLPGCEFDADLRDFSWAEKQNERRRQREKRAAA